MQWLRDNLKLIGSSGDVEALAASVPDTGGVVFVPAFVGLGAPHWDAHAAGMLIGLRRDTKPGHIARAALEAIAFQVADVLEAVHSETGTPLAALRVDGGASVNDLLMQFQADVLGVPVVRPQVTETTALGAAYLAGLATGFWAGPEELRAKRQGDKRFEPKMDAGDRAERRGALAEGGGAGEGLDRVENRDWMRAGRMLMNLARRPEHPVGSVRRRFSRHGGLDGGSEMQSCCGAPEEGEAADEGVRRVPETGPEVAASAHVPGVRACGLLRLVAGPSCAGAFS